MSSKGQTERERMQNEKSKQDGENEAGKRKGEEEERRDATFCLLHKVDAP